MFWKRKKKEFIDLVSLQKKGLLKPRQELDENKILDLTSSSSFDSSSSSNSSSSQGLLGGLGNLASASYSQPQTSNYAYPSEELMPDKFSSVLKLTDNEKTAKLKKFLINLRQTQKDIMARISNISDRIDLIEKKFDRLERKDSF